MGGISTGVSKQAIVGGSMIVPMPVLFICNLLELRRARRANELRERRRARRAQRGHPRPRRHGRARRQQGRMWNLRSSTAT